jgi:lipooligosaccharide transport system permease protein
VAGLFGHLDTVMVVPSILIIFISSFMFASFGLFVVTWVKNYDQIIFPTSGIIIPMSLLSETYFPVTDLPFQLQHVTFLMPLRHTVSAVRGLLMGTIQGWQVLVHAVVLLILSLVLVRWTGNRFRKKLIQ